MSPQTKEEITRAKARKSYAENIARQIGEKIFQDFKERSSNHETSELVAGLNINYSDLPTLIESKIHTGQIFTYLLIGNENNGGIKKVATAIYTNQHDESAQFSLRLASPENRIHLDNGITPFVAMVEPIARNPTRSPGTKSYRHLG